MIDVDSVRRNFGAGPYDPKKGKYLPFGMPPPRPPLLYNHRSLVHWHQPMGISPPSRVPSTEGQRSDEDDEDDDEECPFTPPPPRERLSYTRYQLELLNVIYKEVRFPNSTQKQLIAKRVGITREQVKIWFQNRRRKDVVGTKVKSCDTIPDGSTCSTDSKDSSIRSSPSPDSAETENSYADETIQSNDSEETVVPDVVLRSVIKELLKFVNDPLKGNKKKKRSKSKINKEKADLKKGLAQTLQRGDYDMLSPPNQITPTAFFEKLQKGFNHAKSSSAFANPRDLSKPAQVSSVSSHSDLAARGHRNDTISGINGRHSNNGAFSDQYSHPFYGFPSHLMRSAHSGHYPLNDLNIRKTGPSDLDVRKTEPSGCDIPVLSDLLSYKQSIEARQRNLMNSSVPHYHTMLQHPQSHQMHHADSEKNFHHSMNSFMHGRPLNGILPFPFLAEHPMLLSSLRQPDQILRPAPQYPGSSVADDPYQPLLVTSLSNPYYAPPTTSWSMPGQPKYDAPSSSTFTQL